MTPDTETCKATCGEYSGVGGVGCLLPAGHTGEHHDQEIMWRYHDEPDELAVIRGLVDAAITECQLGSVVAAHFGRILPDTGD